MVPAVTKFAPSTLPTAVIVPAEFKVINKVLAMPSL
jgi:hypothetical protein